MMEQRESQKIVSEWLGHASVWIKRVFAAKLVRIFKFAFSGADLIGPERTGTARHGTLCNPVRGPSVSQSRGCHGGIPRMPMKWRGPAENVPGSVLLHAQVRCCPLSSDGPRTCTGLPSLSGMFGKAGWKIIPILQEDDAYVSGHQG